MSAQSAAPIHDTYAGSYGYSVDLNVASRLKHELIKRHLRPSDRALDVGCANGLHLRLVARDCAEAVGVDLSEKMVALACAKLEEDGLTNASVVRQSATDLAFPDESFDLAYCFSTLVVVDDPAGVIRQMARVLKPGGVAIVDIAGRYNLSQWHWRRYYQAQGHRYYFAYSYPRACAMLQAAGLRVVEAHGLGLLDQWKYVPLLRYARFLETVFHGRQQRDWDYRASNSSVGFPMANRWYLVCRK